MRESDCSIRNEQHQQEAERPEHRPLVPNDLNQFLARLRSMRLISVLVCLSDHPSAPTLPSLPRLLDNADEHVFQREPGFPHLEHANSERIQFRGRRLLRGAAHRHR